VRALDPRLLRYARATRIFLCISVALGAARALLILSQAWLLADVVAGAVVWHKGLEQLQAPLVALLGVVLARALVAWAAELAAISCSAEAKSQLRGALLERVARLGLDSSRRERTGELAILATRGIDVLDGYFSLYLPQLLLAVIVPVVVLAGVFSGDWISGAIIAFTIPLIPLFMGLVGASTRERMDRQLRTLQRLGGHFLDIVAGLPTLKIFGRARAQVANIREVSELYRGTAMSTLRVTFLSSLILELLATISVALVAVAIGLRLMGGQLNLRTALFVLVLAPEAYLPLRQLGASYHASAEGMAAAEQVFAVLEKPVVEHGTRSDVPDPSRVGLAVEDIRVSYPERLDPALEHLSFALEPGETLAIAGPSGCGKSTLLSVLLGFLAPESGTIRIGDIELGELDPDAWRAQLAWVPQRPYLFAASIAENVRLGRPEALDEEVRAAITAAGLSDLVADLPDGLETVLGERGAGLSVGERQRVALARAFLRKAPLLLMDEPTANLDGQTEEEVIEAVKRLANGRTVLLVAHRPALLAMADRVLTLDTPSRPSEASLVSRGEGMSHLAATLQSELAV
jgi:thiol reductant ABC exporter CydD subunit